MKRTKRMMLLTMISLIISFIGYENTVYAATKQQAVSDYSFVIIDGSVDQSMYENLLTNYCKIPLNVRECFQISGWKIVLTDKDLDSLLYHGKYGVGGVIASANNETKIIHIANVQYGINAISHEVGHCLNYMVYGNNCPLSNLDDWRSILNNNSNFANWYDTNQKSEKFAEAFSYYCTDAKYLKNNYPDIYNYIDTISVNVKGLK